VQMLLAAEFEQLDAVVRADLVSEIVAADQTRVQATRRSRARDRTSQAEHRILAGSCR
jgi:hypothetical protein